MIRQIGVFLDPIQYNVLGTYEGFLCDWSKLLTVRVGECQCPICYSLDDGAS